MIRREKWHGKARYWAPGASTTNRISPDIRVYTVTGTGANYPTFQTPYTDEQTGVDLSKVLRVPLGYRFTIIMLGSASLGATVKNRRGITIATINGGDIATFYYTNPTSYYGTWKAQVRTAL